jgi:hypothetical protein
MKSIKAEGPFIYVDTHTVLYYASCFSEIGNLVFAAGPTCSGWSYGGGILRFLNFFGFTPGSVGLLGHFFTYAIICTFIYYLYLTRQNILVQIALFSGFISPPIWLLMERANFDALMYLMVLISAILFIKKMEILSIFFILLSAVFKFYTLPLLILPFLLSTKFKTKFASILSLSIGLTLVILDLNRMTGKIVQAGYNHFGMKIIGNYLGKLGIHLNIYNSYFLATFLFLSCILFVFLAIRKKEFFVFKTQLFSEPSRTIFIYMSSTFLLCFVVGLNVDYRLIFYVVSAPFLISILKTKLKYIAFATFIVGCWLSYPSGIFQTIGDLALEIMASLILIVTFSTLFARNNYSNIPRFLNKFSFLKFK